MRSIDLSPLFRHSVGFDKFDRLFDAAFNENGRDSSYPPYNIVKEGEHRYRVTVAVAGFSDNDIEIIAQPNQLVVRGKIQEPKPDVTYLHRGIAQRAFEHKYQLADHVRVESASLNHGLLEIVCVHELPEAEKPKRIHITTGDKAGKAKVIESEATAS